MMCVAFYPCTLVLALKINLCFKVNRTGGAKVGRVKTVDTKSVVLLCPGIVAGVVVDLKTEFCFI